MELTSEEKRQIQAILDKANAREKETASTSKNGFFSWLSGTSLGWLVSKLLDVAWSAIKSLFRGF